MRHYMLLYLIFTSTFNSDRTRVDFTCLTIVRSNVQVFGFEVQNFRIISGYRNRNSYISDILLMILLVYSLGHGARFNIYFKSNQNVFVQISFFGYFRIVFLHFLCGSHPRLGLEFCWVEPARNSRVSLLKYHNNKLSLHRI